MNIYMCGKDRRIGRWILIYTATPNKQRGKTHVISARAFTTHPAQCHKPQARAIFSIHFVMNNLHMMANWPHFFNIILGPRASRIAIKKLKFKFLNLVNNLNNKMMTIIIIFNCIHIFFNPPIYFFWVRSSVKIIFWLIESNWMRGSIERSSSIVLTRTFLCMMYIQANLIETRNRFPAAVRPGNVSLWNNKFVAISFERRDDDDVRETFLK